MAEFVFMDIDGVLNIGGKMLSIPAPGTYNGLVVKESVSESGRIKKWVVSEEVLSWLKEIMSSPDITFVWSTTHQQRADVFAETFGLPTGKPWIPQPNGHLVSYIDGHTTKMLAVKDWLEDPANEVPEGSQIVIAEDMCGPADVDWAEEQGITLVIPNPRMGLFPESLADIDQKLDSRH